MALPIVMKFGGTSLADVAHIERAARHVQARVERARRLASGGDCPLAVVVSAMGLETDRLANLARACMPERLDGASGRELDMVLSAGEQVSAGLLALELRKLGCKARSFLGWQVPIHTDSCHHRARIRHIELDGLRASWGRGEVAVVAGFQGVDERGEITTLGRGGSDTSAVALAAVLGAEVCEIYTDVEGVFTADPRLVKDARLLRQLSYEEMVEMASMGARVLQTRCVELASKHGVLLRVLPSVAEPGEAVGTDICPEEKGEEKKERKKEELVMEEEQVSGITYYRHEAKVTLSDLADRPGVAARVFLPLARAGILVDMIIQSSAATGKEEGGGMTNITFTVAQEDLTRVLQILESEKEVIGYRSAEGDIHIAKVSVVGVGMRSQVGVAETMFRTLADAGINIQAISTSEIKISVLVAEEEMERTVALLHRAYGLGES